MRASPASSGIAGANLFRLDFSARPPRLFLLLRVLFCWLCAVLGAIPMGVHAVQSVTLAWDPNPEPDVAGYRLLYREATSEQVMIIDVGAGTMATVPELREGRTYLFAVTAYNLAGLESLPSDELPYTVPAPPIVLKLQPINGFSGAFHVSFSTFAGFRYQLQMSEDLSNWTTLWEQEAAFDGEEIHYVDISSPPPLRRFYRAVLVN